MASELRPVDGNGSRLSVKVRAGRRAARQRGRVTSAQVLALGGGRTTVRDWTRAGLPFPELPQVYAFGHPGRSEESDLFAAVLYAGPGAGLRALSAAVWRGFLRWQKPEAIHVATPRRCRSLAAKDPANGLGIAIEVKQKQTFRRSMWNGIPTVPIAQIALDIAATGDLLITRVVLASMDYRRVLRAAELRGLCGRGVEGSVMLREALANPQPRFALVRSWFEIRFIVVCEETGIPLPDTNQYIEDIEVDAVWWEEMLVVMCDGEGNHGTRRQRGRDAAIDARLEALGFEVIRYRYAQLDDPWAIHADLTARLEERRGWAARRRRAA
jgi:hypothetical protein